ncbi:nuclease-related domain-containing protein [Macrococcus equi]|uniref:nuclease-related domain-containing protein n=1 Tax=Macrococcus equi TaxID=3395462 RepID=UPI0039BE36D5
MFLKTRIFNQYERYILEVEGRIEMEQYDKDNLFTTKKGLLGEKYFYEHIKDCNGGAMIWDLRLRLNGQSQYDFIIVSDGKIMHFVTKFYEGNYNYIDGNFVSENGYVIHNPIASQTKQHMRLKRFVDKLGMGYDVLSCIIFVGEQFNATGFNGDKRILFEKDINRIVERLNQREVTEEEVEIARIFIEHYDHKGIIPRILYYPYHEMKKGVKCPTCGEFLTRVERTAKKVKCRCGSTFTKKELVRLAFDAVYILKNSGVTVSDIVDFTGLGRTLIKEVLSKEFQKLGTYKNSKYLPHESNDFLLKENEEKYIYKE